jgi:hypothetical protein
MSFETQILSIEFAGTEIQVTAHYNYTHEVINAIRYDETDLPNEPEDLEFESIIWRDPINEEKIELLGIIEAIGAIDDLKEQALALREEECEI